MAKKGKLQRGYLESKDIKKKIKVSFLFNPTEITVEKSNQFAEVNIPGLSSSLFQFVRGNNRSISMDLFFDTYEDDNQDVRMHTDMITGWDSGVTRSKLPGKKGLMDINSDLHAPPICVFKWGDFEFDCIIERVTKKFTMFLPDGIPVRATLSVTLKEYKDGELQLKEINAQSADLTKRRVLTQGDSLWMLADEEYGDAGLWRAIAEANGIIKPRKLEPGTEIVIPPVE